MSRPVRRGVAPRLYRDLAPWWPILSSPADYKDEAATYSRVLRRHVRGPLRNILELGCGGGNNASHLKARFNMTLVDLSPGMLKVSRRLNPECRHVRGDMRSVRLGTEFDAVFIHDAVMYLTTATDLLAAMRTAFMHLRPGGVGLFVPDHLKETFAPGVHSGGHDGGDRAIRYVEWRWDPDPRDSTYRSEFAYLLRDARGRVRVVQDPHLFGLFPRATWMRLLRRAGFTGVRAIKKDRTLEPGTGDLFVGVRPKRGSLRD